MRCLTAWTCAPTSRSVHPLHGYHRRWEAAPPQTSPPLPTLLLVQAIPAVQAPERLDNEQSVLLAPCCSECGPQASSRAAPGASQTLQAHLQP